MKINRLTFKLRRNYAESLKTTKPAFTPRQSVFFIPMAWMRAENIQYQPKLCLVAFSESTPLLILNGDFLRKTKQMTTLSEVYGVYTNLRQILKLINKKNDTKDADNASVSVCQALCSLESAMAYLPLEDKADRRIKLNLLQKTITEIAEDNNGKIDLDLLTPRAREQLAITLQLIKE